MRSEANIPIEIIKNPDAVTGVNGPADMLNRSATEKNIAHVLLKESTHYTNDSQAKAQQAQQYLRASKDLESLARAVRDKARSLKQKNISEEEKTKLLKELIASLPQELSVLVPQNASEEVLEQIADELLRRAKDFRNKADDLLKDSEESEKIAKQLKEQATLYGKRDISVSEFQLKAASAHNEGLLLVLKKLGIAKLDAEYKKQISDGVS